MGIPRSTAGIVLAAMLALAGCAAHLAPAPEAMVLPGPKGAALGEAGGVRAVARVNAWSGAPQDLPSIVTPVLVMIENASSVPLAARHEQFALDADSGQRFAARAPFEITGTATEVEPAASVGWYPPLYRPYHPFMRDPFYDPYFYDPFIRRDVPLPTADMVQKALPESVIQPGGRASGFVYFERVRDARRATFRYELLNAQTGKPFGEVTIPFVVK